MNPTTTKHQPNSRKEKSKFTKKVNTLNFKTLSTKMKRDGPGKEGTKEVTGERYEKCLGFDGKKEEYQEWKGKVEDWLWAWKHKEWDRYAGLTLRRALGGEFWTLVAGLPRE